MAGDSGTYEVVTSRYLKDRDEPCFPGSGRGGGGGGRELAKGGGEDEEEGEEEEGEEKEYSGRKVAGASSSSSGDPSWAASGYELIDGTLYRKRLERGATSYTEVLVAAAEEQRRAVIAAFHQEPAPGHRHCTMEETYKNVSENYWWEGMFPDIRDYVQGCNQCKNGKDNLLISEEKHITRELPTHCTKVLERLNSQRSKGLFCDVTLIVEKTSYPAHRAVLAAVSEYFQDLFSEKGSTSNKIVDLKGFSSKSFLPLLEFSYTSSLSLKPDYFAETSALARHLRIWEVVEMCSALHKFHGTGNNKAHKEEGKEEKKEFSSFEAFIDQSFTGARQHVSDICSKLGQLEDGTTQHKVDRNVFSARAHSAMIQGETKVSDFTVKFQEMQSGLFKDKVTPVHCESSLNNTEVEGLESSSRRFKLFDFYDKTPPKFFPKVKSLSPQRHPSVNTALSSIPNSLDFKLAGMSRNASHQRKCSFEKTPIKSKPRTRMSKHLDCNIVSTQDNSGCKGMNALLRSPVRQMTTEDELYSPNTTEKYKLLSVLGLRRKTSVIDEEQAGWKQKRRLRQPKVKNYSLLTGTKRRKIDIAKTQLQDDHIRAKALANCFVVIEKILPPVQKQKVDNQKLNKANLALNKSKSLSHKKNVSQGPTKKEMVCIPTKTHINNPKAKTKGRSSCLDKKIQRVNKYIKGSSQRNRPLTKKSQRCKVDSSISPNVLRNGKNFCRDDRKQNAVLPKSQANDSKETEGSSLTRNSRCANYMSVKTSSVRGNTTSKVSPCLIDDIHSGRRKTRQSFNSSMNYSNCNLNLDNKIRSCPQSVALRRCASVRMLPTRFRSLDQTPKLMESLSDDTCSTMSSKTNERQVLDENSSHQLSPKAGVGNIQRFKGKYEGNKLVPNIHQNTCVVGNEQKRMTRLAGKPIGNDQPTSQLRSKQEAKKPEQLKPVFKDPGKQTRTASCEKMQSRRKVKNTRCQSLGAENQNSGTTLHNIQAHGSIPILGKRKHIPTQKLIESGFSFGFFMSERKKKTDMPKLSNRTDSKQFELSPSCTLKGNHATKAKVDVQENSKHTISVKQTLVNIKQNCCKTECGIGRNPSCSEISERAKGVPAKNENVKLVGLYGKKLINLNIKNALLDKRAKHPNTIMKDEQLSTSQKAIKLQRVARASSKLIGSKDPPKNLRGAAQILKKMQPKINATLKLTRRRKSVTGEKVKKTKVSESHTCYECSTTFINCDSLFVHRMKHIKGKSWQCLLCDKSFFRQKNVQIHLRCHNEKLYRCRQCMTDSKKSKSFQAKR
ncbi:uncharacterized protein si:dkey-229b18.3 isoform X1 [Chiloscyllium plagiosum]|uniref:uncharacterized protein si:dkey-229b18.3 isoform X1 n=1 Tax=Chiloscyllium plagiosum TaxID=36176 RepID=UPI001CB7CB57|nr:uncharacterized protein si:dkey-229b18.3 isoform X1 [Chiloscyllium plagiosum]